MSGFKFDASKLVKGIAEREIKTKVALGLYADTYAKKAEAYAKQNRKWQDHTHDARDRLNGTWKWIGNIARIELSHGVDYGIYLEFCNEKRYAIIKPTIDHITPSAIKGLQNIIK